MVSRISRIHSLVFRFALLAFVSSGRWAQAEKITLQQLLAEFRGEPPDLLRHHFGLMFTVTGYGDTLYDTTVNVSADCALTCRTTLRLLEQLKSCEEAYLVVIGAITSCAADMQPTGEQLGHPLEYFCRRVVDSISQKAHLKAAFEAARTAARNVRTGRPPYSSRLVDSMEKLGQLIGNCSSIPELARSIAVEAFRNQADASKAYSSRYHLFVKSVFAVAQKDQLTQSLQDLYEKTLEAIVPQIASKESSHALLLADKKTFWFFPKMIRMVYNSIAENPILLRELNSAAAIIGKGYDVTDLDFSKL